MKYIIFKQRNMMLPVIIPDHITHADVKVEGAVPYSAGFFLLGTEDIVTIAPAKSDSLGIGPKDGDRELIIAALANCGMYAFMRI